MKKASLEKSPESRALEKTVSMEIDASAESCFELMRDLESYPSFIRGMQETRILNQGNGSRGVTAEFVLGFLSWKVRYVLNYTFDEKALALRWDYVEGDIEDVTGWYGFEPLGGKRCRATYHLENFVVREDWKIPKKVMDFAERIMMRRSVADLKRMAERSRNGR